MQPINTAERRKAFINFILFFTITVSIIVTTVFFSIQVPLKHNKQLRNDVAEIEKEKDFTASFTSLMNETVNQLDSVNNVENPALLDGSIRRNLDKMTTMINDSISDKNLYLNIVRSLNALYSVNKGLREANSRAANAGELLQQINTLRTQLAQTNSQLILCQGLQRQQPEL